MAINNIPRSFQQWPNTYANAAAAPVSATPADFNLDSGLYAITVSGGVFGTATLQKLLPDGATYVAVAPNIVAPGYSTVQLPAGQYRMLLTGVTGFVGVIELISRGPLR